MNFNLLGYADLTFRPIGELGLALGEFGKNESSVFRCRFGNKAESY